jgi:hypothetical protein
MKLSHRNHEQGSATLLMIGFLALLLVVLAANTASVNHVRMDLRRIDREQQSHWNTSRTNSSRVHPTRP